MAEKKMADMTQEERWKALEESHDDYWDCECEKNYIHLKEKGRYCPVCDCYEVQGQPDSRALEVKEMYDPKKDTAIDKIPICPTCKKEIGHGWCCDCEDLV